MEMSANLMEINLAGHTVQARLMKQENPEVVNLICNRLPVTTFALHTNVSGKGIWLPTPIITYSGGHGHMVNRHPGAVYFFSQGQSIIITYGDTHESAPVNKFAQAIFDDTLASAQHKVVPATVRLFGGNDTNDDGGGVSIQKQLEFDGGWRSVKSIFMAEAKRALEEEPDEIFASFTGRIIPSGMGTGGNVLAVWMHQWSALMTGGPNTLHRFLDDSEIPGVSLGVMVDISRNHFLWPFNYFEFMAELGLASFKEWGEMYSAALGDLKSLEEYRELTAALLSLMNSYLYRVQSRFPFYMGKSFPRISKEEIIKLSTILD